MARDRPPSSSPGAAREDRPDEMAGMLMVVTLLLLLGALAFVAT